MKAIKQIRIFVPLFIILIGIALRLIYSISLPVESGTGDSIARGLITLQNEPKGLLVWYNYIWPSIYFIVYTIPLYFSKTLLSFKMTTFLFSSLNILLFYLLLKKYFSENFTFIALSLCLFSTLPLALTITGTLLSENLFISFLFLGLYFYNLGEKVDKEFILSSLFFVLATQIRYEGLVFLLIVFFLEFFYNKSSRRFLTVLVPFLVLVFSYEFYQVKFGHSLFSSILSNGKESFNTNIRIGASSPELRFKSILVYYQRNLSWLFPILLPGIFLFLKNNKNNPTKMLYLTFFLAFSFTLFFNVYLGTIALFDRYFILHMFLTIPFLCYCILPLTRYKKITHTFTCILLFFSIYKFYSVNSKIKEKKPRVFEVTQFIHSLKDVSSIYFDDHRSQYFFNEFRFYSKFIPNNKILKVYSIDYNVNRLEHDQFNSIDLLNINNYIYNGLDLIIVINKSRLHQHLQKNDNIIYDFQLTPLKEFDNFLIYCVHDRTCKKYN